MNDDLKRWDEAAEDWATHIVGLRAHSTVLTEKTLPLLLGNVNGKKILDAGCGEGRYSKFLMSLGADVVGIDGAENMIALAKSQYPGINFQVGDLLEPLSFANKSFDNIISIVVLVSLKQIKTFLQESFRILKDDGSAIISVTHPAFGVPTMKLYRSIWGKLTGKQVVGLATNYFQKVTQRKEDYAKNPWPFYHRTIEDYSQAFKQSGFVIEEIAEPNQLPKEFLASHPEFEYATRLPRFIFFKLIKLYPHPPERLK